jgi:hypothetical protein
VSQDEKNEIFKGFLIDCIMGNWDVFNNNNVGICCGEPPIPIRTDVGGALAFRGRGDENIQFIKNNEPFDHISISRQSSFDSLYINTMLMQTPLDYLKSISVTEMKTRLAKVKKEFSALIDMVNEKKFATKYHALLDGVLEAVTYRDAWYRKNGDAAIESIRNRFSDYITGGSGDNIIKNKLNDLDIDIASAPMSFAASPGQFARLLARHQQCAWKKSE